MGIAHALTQTATIANAPETTEDAEGNWTPGTVATTTEPCLLQPIATAETFGEGTDQTTTRYRLFLLASTVATARARVTVGGVDYQVEGKPLVYSTPRGGPHHTEAEVSRIEE